MDDVIQKIYSLAKKKMREQGGYDRETYEGFIDENIDYYVSRGQLDENENIALIKDQLMSMWETAQDSLSDDEPQYNFPV